MKAPPHIEWTYAEADLKWKCLYANVIQIENLFRVILECLPIEKIINYYDYEEALFFIAFDELDKHEQKILIEQL